MQTQERDQRHDSHRTKRNRRKTVGSRSTQGVYTESDFVIKSSVEATWIKRPQFHEAVLRSYIAEPTVIKVDYQQSSDVPNSLWPSIHDYSKPFEALTTASLLNFESALLRPYKELVKQSVSMLKLEKGWDEDAAEVIDPFLFKASTDLMYNYIKDFFSRHHSILPNPKINPLPDGTIDFEWYNAKARLLINFRNEASGIKAYYYGDRHNNNIPIKGHVPTDKVYIHLLEWMQNL